MNLLESLAGITPSREPIRVEVVKGQFLEFRAPTEGEIDAFKVDCEREADVYFKDKYEPTAKQREWLPAKRETFVRATLLSHFIEAEDKSEARRQLCMIGKRLPITFTSVFNSWQSEAVNAELKAFAEEVESRKNSSEKTESDSSD